ncbi:iron complex transport system substrate-binding protein [Pseudonocardia thermophila]|jgi:ABC-type Fe2+-enterobactin transport system, periplasmic component|uniref:Iron complex transport system substrate-binding protein n=1 Tax=Pseudonocardia thermophila TaxID=1848 RepID=A0A1M7ANK1_PSETH|nr:Fe2+-enterobactin ABC transporter substrate-binding protein [Pseudonocardia thermophila]SHL44324.1 iron complex transport system substrate-binding protein [Pseudonocardia thermophila]
MRQRYGIAAILATAALLLAGCGGGSAEPAPTPEEDTRTVTHALGTTEIPASPQRIASASITMTGPLLGLDAPVIATATTAPNTSVADANGFFKAWAGVAAQRGVVPLGGPEVPIEAVAGQRPDLIVGSAVGADAVTPEVYNRLSQIAPTIVFDHSGVGWTELSATLGAALGREEQAEAAEAEFTARVKELDLDTSHPAVALTVVPDGLNVFTPESAQGKLLISLGLTVPTVEASGTGGLSGSDKRRDVVSVAHERAGSLGDATLYIVNAEAADVERFRSSYPVLAALPAFTEGRVHPLGPESFRLDRFAALAVLDRLR